MAAISNHFLGQKDTIHTRCSMTSSIIYAKAPACPYIDTGTEVSTEHGLVLVIFRHFAKHFFGLFTGYKGGW